MSLFTLELCKSQWSQVTQLVSMVSPCCCHPKSISSSDWAFQGFTRVWPTNCIWVFPSLLFPSVYICPQCSLSLSMCRFRHRWIFLFQPNIWENILETLIAPSILLSLSGNHLTNEIPSRSKKNIISLISFTLNQDDIFLWGNCISCSWHGIKW